MIGLVQIGKKNANWFLLAMIWPIMWNGHMGQFAKCNISNIQIYLQKL